MDIGDVSKRSGISASALRYYEEIGLIHSDDRKGLRRQYSNSVLDVLALITLAKEAEFFCRSERMECCKLFGEKP